MKDPKILPFGSWFKVYEQAGRNFKKSQQILESRSYRGLQRIFEQRSNSSKQNGVGEVPAVKQGNAIYDISDGSVTPAWGWVDQAEDGILVEVMNKAIGWQAMPALYIMSGRYTDNPAWSKSSSMDALFDVFKLMIGGIGRYHGIEYFGDQLIDGLDPKNDAQSAIKRIQELGLKVVPAGEVQFSGATVGENGWISSSAKIENGGTELNTRQGKSTIPVNNPKVVCNYVNTFNIINFANGDCTQYVDLENCLDANKILQFGIEAKGVEKAESSFYIYSPFKAGVEAGTTETTTTTTQGVEGLSEEILIQFNDFEFANAKTAKGDGPFPVDSSFPEIQGVAQKIVENLKEGDQITSMTIVTGASPSWPGVANVPESNGSGDPSGGKLTDSTFKAEKTALGNEWLAWRRGKQFENALRELLKDRITADAITIEWQVKKQGLAGGKNLKYTVNSAGVAPKEIVDTEFVRAKRTVTGSTKSLVLYRYRYTWDTKALTDLKANWMKKITFGLAGKDKVGFGDLDKGDKIIVKVPEMARGEKTGKFLEIEKEIVRRDSDTNQLYIAKKDGTEVKVTEGPGDAQFVKSLATVGKKDTDTGGF
jgi:hypothetical protein